MFNEIIINLIFMQKLYDKLLPLDNHLTRADLSAGFLQSAANACRNI